jgi:hypothetical protein
MTEETRSTRKLKKNPVLGPHVLILPQQGDKYEMPTHSLAVCSLDGQ